MVFDLFKNDPFLREFIYLAPQEGKPPYEVLPFYDQERKTVIGWDILFALAGFKEEYLKVWAKKNILYIEGDNSKEGSYAKDTKFQCKFKREFKLGERLDLSKMTVDFEDGLLMIHLPIKEEVDSDTVFFLGSPEKKLTQ